MSYFENMVRPCLLDRHKIKVVSQPEFIILVNTTLAGSASDTMQLPIRGTDMTIDWGDGFVQTEVTQTATPSSANWVTRVYPDGGGVKQIKITGLDWIYFNNAGDRLKLLEIQNWGTGQWATMSNAFWNCQNMTGTFTDVPNLSNVTNMGNMFRFAFIFNSDISQWDVSGVTNMDNMFRFASIFNSDISQWDVGNVTDVERMFNGANNFNSDISGWDVGNVTNMAFMLNGANNFNSDISGWDVGNVTNMIGTFEDANNFNSDISLWDVSGVTDMRRMFQRATNFNQDLSGWCVSQIGSLPSDFDTGATSWVLPRPIWGECP